LVPHKGRFEEKHQQEKLRAPSHRQQTKSTAGGVHPLKYVLQLCETTKRFSVNQHLAETSQTKSRQTMSDDTLRIFNHPHPFQLESGAVLPGFHLAYTTHGQLNASKDNVIWIFHALTANANPLEWWAGLAGPGLLFDPERHFIVCVNMPGSCYGSIGPLSMHAEKGQPYFHDFPFFTPRDMIRAYQHLRTSLGIRNIRLGIGGSMGGQQLLEWAVEEPDLFTYIVPIATNAEHSAWGRAFNASQRMAIESDPSWTQAHPEAGMTGLRVARSIALLSYRHYSTYLEKQSDTDPELLHGFRSESYQRYQGEKLARRFNAFSYVALSRGMDSHHLGRGRGSVPAALRRISAQTLVIGITSDVLFPPSEQEFLARHIPRATFAAIHSDYGHDGFLLEDEKITAEVLAFAPELAGAPAHYTTGNS
jgi:homoserine O-acetyltransferase